MILLNWTKSLEFEEFYKLKIKSTNSSIEVNTIEIQNYSPNIRISKTVNFWNLFIIFMVFTMHN